jgi:hypothetical protein
MFLDISEPSLNLANSSEADAFARANGVTRGQCIYSVRRLKRGNWFVLGDPVKGSLALLNDVAEAEREISQRRPKHFRVAKDLAHAEKMISDARAKHQKEQKDAREKAKERAKAKRNTTATLPSYDPRFRTA